MVAGRWSVVSIEPEAMREYRGRPTINGQSHILHEAAYFAALWHDPPATSDELAPEHVPKGRRSD